MNEQVRQILIFIAASIGLGITLSGFLYIIGLLAQLSNDHPILSILGLCCVILIVILLLRGDF